MKKYRVLNIEDNNIYKVAIQYALKRSEFLSLCSFKHHHAKDLNENYFSFVRCLSEKRWAKQLERAAHKQGKWESKEFRASQGRKNHSTVNPAPAKGMEKTDQAERRSCLAER